MKRIFLYRIGILLCLSFSSVCLASFINLYGEAGTNGTQVSNEQKPETFSNKETQCVKWENVCVDRQNCIYRSPLREGGCYRCLKPSHYGVHLYPRMESRDTCSYDTAQYLRTMGYNCYVPYQASPCLSQVTTQECHMKCVQYQDESEEFNY